MTSAHRRPDETIAPAERREQVRHAWLAEGSFYSPWLHLGFTSVVGVALVIGAACLLVDVRAWEWALSAALLLGANAGEWRLHRDVLHRRFAPASSLYERQALHHHVVFITDDMAIRGARELRLVLIPAVGIALAFLGLLPIAAAIWLLGQHNLGALFAAVMIAYVVLYEWTHLAYHLPADSRVGRLGVARPAAPPRHPPRPAADAALELQHHRAAVDWLRRTRVRSTEEGLARERKRREASGRGLSGVTVRGEGFEPSRIPTSS